MVGSSGGEFGIVGAVEARDVNTGELIWHRPVVEGNMGTLRGKDNGITGKLLSAQWDPWKDGTLEAKRDALAKSDIFCLRRIVPEDRPGKW